MRAEVSPWVRSPGKRILDVALSLLALPVVLPVAAIAAVLVRMTMGQPTLFVQDRIGQDGRPFRLMKFRTMTSGSTGPEVTGAGDPRVTGVGRWLRRTKIDEFPQMINVIRGEMAIVGPRPEVPRYVEMYGEDQRRVLGARPGLTDPATLEFREEETLLGSVPLTERDAFYVREVMPRKLQLNLDYLRRATAWSDIVLIVKTVVAVLRGARQ